MRGIARTTSLSSVQMPHTADVDAKISPDLVRQLYLQAPAALTTTVVVAGVLAAFLWPVAGGQGLTYWLVAMLSVTVLRSLLVVAFHLVGSRRSVHNGWARAYTQGTFLAGLAWGLLALLWDPAWNVEYQVLLMLALAGISAGAISADAAWLSSFVAFVFPTTLPMAGVLLTHNDAAHTGLGILMLVYPGALLLIARNYHRTLKESLRRRYDNQELLDELKVLNSSLEQRVMERTRVLHQEIARRSESEHKLSSITEAIFEAIIMIDETGGIVFWNKAAERITGYERDEVLNKDFQALIAPERYREDYLKGLPPFTETESGPITGTTVETVAVHKNGREFPVELSISAIHFDERWHIIGVMRDTTERKHMETVLRTSKATYQTLVDNLPQRIFYKDKNSVYVSANRRYAEDLGIDIGSLPGRTDFDFFPRDLAERYRSDDRQVIATGEMRLLEEPYVFNGEERWIHTEKIPLKDEEGQPAGVLGIFWDITEQKRAEEERQRLELELRQAQKLEAVGQLAAGIAHEINTPTQYVSDNIHFLQDAFADQVRLLEAYEQLTNTAAGGSVPDGSLEEVQALAAEIDIDYLKEEAPKAIAQSIEGLERVTTIVKAMKEFAHPGSEEKIPTDLNKAIQTTVDVARNEWKYYADLEMDLDPSLVEVAVLRGEFNQVILNLIVNAAHAIADAGNGSGTKGLIRITSRREEEWAEIRVSDTGIGIPESIRSRIFDPFFTTKEVGRGTGQGLAIAYSSVVDKHCGTIEVASEEGKGSMFTVRLPLSDKSERPARKVDS